MQTQITVLISTAGVALAGIVSAPSAAIAGPDIGGHNMTCDADHLQQSTIETCNNAVEFYREQIMSLKEARQRDRDFESPEKYQNEMLNFERKLYDVNAVLSKMRRSGERPATRHSSYVWPQSIPPQTNPSSLDSSTWAGVMAIGVPSYSTQFDYMFEVSGTITVPAIALPNNATCGASTTTYETGQWIGIVGESNNKLAYDPDQGQLVQAGVSEKLVCSPGNPSGQVINQVFVEDFINSQSTPVYPPVPNVNEGDVLSIDITTSAGQGGSPTMYYTISDTAANGQNWS
jgi:hypothetical protein